MKKKNVILAVLALAAVFSAQLSAETVTMADKADFYEIATAWNEAWNADSYENYQDTLIEVSNSIIPDDLYQYMLGEALFYKYYASSFIEMPENEELDECLQTTIEYCASIENDYPVLRTVTELFRSLQSSAPFRNTTPAVFFSEEGSERPVETSMLPDAASGRLLMLRTLAEVEAMSQRLQLASESRGGEVLLKFSKDAYLNVMEKPAMVYVISHEPVYAELREVLERSSDGVDTDTFGPSADAFYRFEALVAQCEHIAAVYGIPLSSVLSEEAWTAMMLYHTDPFAVLSLNETALDRLNLELEFIADKCLPYVERINALPEKREGSL